MKRTEHNESSFEALKAKYTPKLNGIECDGCGNELKDLYPGLVTAIFPQQTPTWCDTCVRESVRATKQSSGIPQALLIQKDTDQKTTTEYADLVGWKTPDLSDPMFNFDPVTGELEFLENALAYVTVSVTGDMFTNSGRTELIVQGQYSDDGGATYINVDGLYFSVYGRGGSYSDQVNGCTPEIPFRVLAGMKIKIQTLHIGYEVTIKEYMAYVSIKAWPTD